MWAPNPCSRCAIPLEVTLTVVHTLGLVDLMCIMPLCMWIAILYIVVLGPEWPPLMCRMMLYATGRTLNILSVLLTPLLMQS